MSFSDYAEGAVLDHVFNKTSYIQPTLYLAVSTANPTDAGTGAAEPVGNAYARVSTIGTDWSRTAAVMSNGVEMAFPEATGSWGTLTHFALYDALTAGNMVVYGALTTAKAIAASETLRFPIGNLTFTLD
jgi:hypothetical protein